MAAVAMASDAEGTSSAIAEVQLTEAKGEDKGNAAKEKTPPAPYGKILKMQSDYLLHLLLMCLCSAAACAFPSIAFFEMARTFTVLYYPDPDKMRKDAVDICITLGIYAAATIGAWFFSGLFNGLAGSSLIERLRARGMKAMLRQDIGYFDMDGNSATELTAFLSEKVDKVMALTTEYLDLVAQLAGGLGSALTIVFWLCSWQLALVLTSIVPVLGVLGALQSQLMSGGAEAKAKEKGKDLSKSEKVKAEAGQEKIIGEAVMGIRTVAAFNLEQRFFDDFTEASKSLSKIGRKDALIGGLFNGLTFATMIWLLGVVFYYGVWLAGEGVLEINEAIAPMFVMVGAFLPLMKITGLADAKNATLAAMKLFSLLESEPTIDAFSDEGKTLDSVSGTIEVRDVKFAYPSAPDHLVCKGYSLSIPAGQTVALCGPSGSGKSTIIQLIERFYDPQSGAVLLDGVDIKELNVRWLRAQLGLVSQEPVLFQGTVAQNIAYGKATAASQQEIEEAATMANAHTFITQNLGEGYATEVGLKGGKLSGGQKQRVAIARALIKKPSVLLLDEATSALDNESEKVVQLALDEIMKKMKRTTVVIAHRLSTIRGADKIAVVNEGSIVEEGSHDELLAAHGLYANLVLGS